MNNEEFYLEEFAMNLNPGETDTGGENEGEDGEDGKSI